MRPILLLLAFLMQGQILFITACRPASTTAATPTPLSPSVQPSTQLAAQPISIAAVTAQATPTVEVPATTVQLTTTLDLAPFTLTLPTPWSALRPSADEWQQEIQTLTTIKPDLAQALLALQPLTTTLVLAWPPTTMQAITLVAAVIPAEDVNLQTYVAAATAELQQQPSMTAAKITVQRADVRYDLHPEHLPLATLHYTRSASGTAPSLTGYQVMTLDKTAAHMILLTFTIREAQPEAALAVVESIVATLREK